jgi:UDP-N-acetylglucosamine--dolichyl-phosphate N-acetylglucosaminephosphotransferase
MEPILLITIFVSFFCTYLLLPPWIKKAREEGLTGKDMHKRDGKEIAEGGGIVVLLGTAVGILSYIAIKTFYFKSDGIIVYILTILCVLSISSIVGIVDDLIGWKKGLSKKIRILIILFAAIPLMVINAGESSMMGINFGILFPLLIIPIGVLGATTTFNFLAGYNGLETGQGIILLSALAIVVYLTGNSWLSLIVLYMVASLVAFYIFNKSPAKVFPGDIMTYSIGAMIATVAILGNIEKIAVFFFIPYILETILKLRGGLKKESFAKVEDDGSLGLLYNKIYGLEHLAIKILRKVKPSRKVYEKDVVYLIHGFQMVIILIGFLIFT